MDTEPVGFSIAIAQHVTEGLQRPGLSEMLAGHAKLLGLPDGGEDLPLLLAQTRRDVGALLTFDPVYLRDTHGKSTEPFSPGGPLDWRGSARWCGGDWAGVGVVRAGAARDSVF